MSSHLGSLTPQMKRSGPNSWGKDRWAADNAKLYPPNIREFDDFENIIDNFILPGFTPADPIFDETSTVVTMGSCFAQELKKFLKAAGVTAGNFWVPSGLNNTFALLDFLQWCVDGKQSDAAYRYDRMADGSIQEWCPNETQVEYLDKLASADLFVITLGLAEVWRHHETGEVFWRGVPEAIFDSALHKHELSTVEENADNVRRIVSTIRRCNDHARIVFTLSPVPLNATFREMSCMAADTVSKSVLRVALDLALATSTEGVYYFPSFEIVKSASPHCDERAFGADDKNTRHVSGNFVRRIIRAFVQHYATDSMAELAANNSKLKDQASSATSR